MEKETFEFIYSEKANLQSFMKAVQKCENDVWFETLEGDKLSLKSTFCQVNHDFPCWILPEVLRGAKVREQAVRIIRGYHYIGQKI